MERRARIVATIGPASQDEADPAGSWSKPGWMSPG